MGFVLVLGGARSGKSAFANRLGLQSGRAVTFIATATAEDEEMMERIARHRAERTVEAPLELRDAIAARPADDFLIVDCLTLWVSNLLGASRLPDDIRDSCDAAAEEMATRDGVVVTNEVGLGIVPANPLARTFRDTLGRVNAAFAMRAERSLLMVAGRSLELA
ncbi:MAG: bifunctional adenosylcobinamide kinase/adenosylcobinamide-phosphate guanylyltransferase [Chloroflexi bacterium]|nr:MAG: bifunctional adenosylcobinamide kinase/adenosylcobinamide-phosphate guanylyltransferase [Chloroflexota bacterium]